MQRRGLGKFLMTLLKLVAKHHQLEWIMLTVLNVRGAMCPSAMVNTQGTPRIAIQAGPAVVWMQGLSTLPLHWPDALEQMDAQLPP